MLCVIDSGALEGAFVAGSAGERGAVMTGELAPESLFVVVINLTQQLTLSLVVTRAIASCGSVDMTIAAFDAALRSMSVRLRTVAAKQPELRSLSNRSRLASALSSGSPKPA